MSFKRLSGEKVRVNLKGVQYKKKDGTLSLTNKRVVWHSGADAFAVKFEDISSVSVSMMSYLQNTWSVLPAAHKP
jgi:hypothetical protein